MNDISPKYQMQLVDKLESAIWKEYSSYKKVQLYLKKWHIDDSDWNNNNQNFYFQNKANGEIDLLGTLHGMNGELLVKIAIDLGVETPDFIPSVPMFRNEIKSSYKTAGATFEKAFKQIELHPETAIGLANSALESIVKEILKDDRISSKSKGNETLYELTNLMLKEFQMYPTSEMPREIRTIGSSLLSANQGIEKLRSEKTDFHGKTEADYLIKDSIYAYFVVNSVATIGLFLISYYQNKFPKEQNDDFTIDDLPF